MIDPQGQANKWIKKMHECDDIEVLMCASLLTLIGGGRRSPPRQGRNDACRDYHEMISYQLSREGLWSLKASNNPEILQWCAGFGSRASKGLR